MFDEVVYEIQHMLEVRIDNDVVDTLRADVEDEVAEFARMHEGEDVSSDEIRKHFSTELESLWSIKYPSRELYDIIDEIVTEVDVDLDPYAMYYLNQLQTSIVANLLYASAVLSKWEGRDEPIDEELVDETCEAVFDKALLRC